MCHQEGFFGRRDQSHQLESLYVDKGSSKYENQKPILIYFFNAFADGNGAAIFTQSGATARKFEKVVEAGQLGVDDFFCRASPLT